jgi:regulator of sigma E protease
VDIFGLVPSFGGLLSTVAAFVVALSIIVAVHEYGHYIAGRWSGIHAEVFSIGFGPRLIAFTDRRGTRWQIAALPLGGYVRFMGDADAASGKDGAAIGAMDESQRRHTMHGAPLWARSATVAAGPIANFLMSIAIFAGSIMATGVAVDAPVVGKLRPLPAAVQELQPGDRILAVGGIETPDTPAFAAAVEQLAPAPTVDYRVLRDGVALTVRGPFPFPPVAASVQPASAAQEAGLRPGDVILAVDGTPVSAFRELREKVGASGGAALRLTVWRDGEVFDLVLVPRLGDERPPGGGFETRWQIGLLGGLAFEPETRTPGPLEALARGAAQTWHVAGTSLSALGHIVTGRISTCNLRGPIGIAEILGAAASQGLEWFIWILAGLSTAVGLLNLFPVPVLDGGHLVFHAWEAVTGKPPSDGALRVLMGIGLVLLLSLMAFALTNDAVFCP